MLESLTYYVIAFSSDDKPEVREANVCIEGGGAGGVCDPKLGLTVCYKTQEPRLRNQMIWVHHFCLCNLGQVT